jgi:hypothetical protein
MRRARTIGAGLAVAVGTAATFLALARAQQIHRNGFEGRDPAWVKGASDGSFQEIAHRITDTGPHTGQACEYIELHAEAGSYIHYVYHVSRAPVTEELSARLWVRANRPGVQLMARVVLPHEPNPTNLDDRLTVMIRGDQYQYVGRWEPLELRQPVKLAQEQQQLMRLDLKRDVDFTDAYVDQLVLNVYSGPGQTQVWLDDLQVGPVSDSRPPAQLTSRPLRDSRPGQPALPLRPPARSALVEYRDGLLLVNGRRFFFRGIRHSDTPLEALQLAGFNTIWFDYQTPPALVEEAVGRGFWVVPSLPVTTGRDVRLTSAEGIADQVMRFPASDAVLFWDLGGGLAAEQARQVELAANAVRAADPQRPIGVDAWDGLQIYSMNVPLLSVHRFPLNTSLELPQFRTWLSQRLYLARPGTFLWTWVQTHLPDWYTNLIYGRSAAAGFSEPIGPQPEQIRLLTYTALAAGCRGLGFWSDRFLADSHQGRDRLLELALLNQELQMLEPLLTTADTPEWIDTSIPDVKAAVMHTDRGMLVLPMWVGKGSQYCPGQSATAQLSMVVPEVPRGTSAWQVCPAEVRSLRARRDVGGMRVTVPEFALTTAIVFTADTTGLLVRFQEQTRHMSPHAAHWAYELAKEEIRKVRLVEAELEKIGHKPPDADKLLQNADLRLKTCMQDFNSGLSSEAYWEADRVLRPLRILMRAQWEEASRGLDSPVASPYAVSFYTLPQHWRFLDELKRATPGANLLPDGDFELSPNQTAQAWGLQQTTLDEVTMEARRVTDLPKSGRQCLMLRVGPRNPQLPPPAALERTFLAINSPAVRLTPGSNARISGYVRIPEPIKASADGALFYDSAGGEPLAVRLTGKTEWRRFVLYRRVPASGLVNVTLALTGLGTVYFDDIRIEPMSDAVSAYGVRAP